MTHVAARRRIPRDRHWLVHRTSLCRQAFRTGMPPTVSVSGSLFINHKSKFVKYRKYLKANLAARLNFKFKILNFQLILFCVPTKRLALLKVQPPAKVQP